MLIASWASIPLHSILDGLLHPSSKTSIEAKKRHSLFIAVHLAVGTLALAALPVYLLVAEQTNIAMTLTPIWMVAPLLSVAYLSQTGKLANAFLVSAGLMAAFVCWIASMTGGLGSPHLIWLGVIPLEVALSGKIRLIKTALLMCLTAVAGLSLAHFLGLPEMIILSSNNKDIVGIGSVLIAVAYGGLLAARIEMLHRGRMKSVMEEELRYRTIADTVSDMITRHDMSGDVTFVSRGSCQLLNRDVDDLLDHGLFQQIHIPDRPAYLQALSDCKNLPADDNGPVTVEMQIRTLHGLEDDAGQGMAEATGFANLSWVEMKCAPERNALGQIVGAIVATRDISKRKKHQQEIEEARNVAEAANDAKTRFLANVTHELRIPLNTIIGFSEILLHPEFTQGAPERNREYAELIHNGGHHLLQLVNALLDMSRLESGNFEVNAQHFDMKDLVQSCCKMMQADADKRDITLFSQLEHRMPDVNADPRACRQILLNLMSNAIKFSDENSKVSVSLDWAKGIDGKKDKTQIALRVRDEGIGISQNDIETLGTPFVQAENALDRRFEGTGIGLSIVKGLAELQYGDMLIESQLNIGTTVTITLPVDMEDAAKNQPDSVISLSGSASNSEGTQEQAAAPVASLSMAQ